MPATTYVYGLVAVTLLNSALANARTEGAVDTNRQLSHKREALPQYTDSTGSNVDNSDIGAGILNDPTSNGESQDSDIGGGVMDDVSEPSLPSMTEDGDSDSDFSGDYGASSLNGIDVSSSGTSGTSPLGASGTSSLGGYGTSSPNDIDSSMLGGIDGPSPDDTDGSDGSADDNFLSSANSFINSLFGSGSTSSSADIHGNSSVTRFHYNATGSPSNVLITVSSTSTAGQSSSSTASSSATAPPPPQSTSQGSGAERASNVLVLGGQDAKMYVAVFSLLIVAAAMFSL